MPGTTYFSGKVSLKTHFTCEFSAEPDYLDEKLFNFLLEQSIEAIIFVLANDAKNTAKKKALKLMANYPPFYFRP